MKSSIFLLLIVIMPFNAGAYVYGGSNLGYLLYPSHGCHKPIKPREPYSSSSRWEVDAYNHEVESFGSQFQEYISCIEEYTDNASSDIERIKEKVREANDEANNC